MLKEHLLEYSKRGLIQAPDESEEHFFQRCLSALPTPTFCSSTFAKKMFDIEPDWVEMIYSNTGLRFWEGACTWIDQDKVTLQLKPMFQKKQKYFGYRREEVIAHELVHVVRSHFEEPIFEEILSYQSSTSWFRRNLAPFFRTPKESLLFMCVLGAFVVTTLFHVGQMIALGLFLSLLMGGIVRLFNAQRTFARAKKRLSKLVGQEKVLAVLLRLTDREIIRFSKMHEEDIRMYAHKMAKLQIRWQQIVGAYF